MEVVVLYFGIALGSAVGYAFGAALATGARADEQAERALREQHDDFERAGDELRIRGQLRTWM